MIEKIPAQFVWTEQLVQTQAGELMAAFSEVPLENDDFMRLAEASKRYNLQSESDLAISMAERLNALRFRLSSTDIAVLEPSERIELFAILTALSAYQVDELLN